MKDFDRKKFSTTSSVSSGTFQGKSHTGIEEKFWVNLDGVDYLYKIDREKVDFGFGELFTSHLGQKMGFDCVNCYPAEDEEKGTKGVMVESYLTEDVIRTLTLEDFVEKYDKRAKHSWNPCHYSIEEFLSKEKKANKDGLYYAPDLIQKMKQMVLVDYLLGQTDRHRTNVEFLVKKDPETGNNILTLAPMFDNGRIFGLDTGGRSMVGGFITARREVPRMTMFSRQDGSDAWHLTECVAYSIVEEMDRDLSLKELYENFKSMDIRQELEAVAKETGRTLDQKDLEYMARYFEGRIDVIETCIQQKKENPRMFVLSHNKDDMRFQSIFFSWKRNILRHERKLQKEQEKKSQPKDKSDKKEKGKKGGLVELSLAEFLAQERQENADKIEENAQGKFSEKSQLEMPQQDLENGSEVENQPERDQLEDITIVPNEPEAEHPEMEHPEVSEPEPESEPEVEDVLAQPDYDDDGPEMVLI